MSHPKTELSVDKLSRTGIITGYLCNLKIGVVRRGFLNTYRFHCRITACRLKNTSENFALRGFRAHAIDSVEPTVRCFVFIYSLP